MSTSQQSPANHSQPQPQPGTQPVVPVSAAPTTLREAFKQYMVVTQRGPKTIEHYLNAIEQFYTFLRCKNPLYANINDIRAFLFHLGRYHLFDRELSNNLTDVRGT